MRDCKFNTTSDCAVTRLYYSKMRQRQLERRDASKNAPAAMFTQLGRSLYTNIVYVNMEPVYRMYSTIIANQVEHDAF